MKTPRLPWAAKVARVSTARRGMAHASGGLPIRWPYRLGTMACCAVATLMTTGCPLPGATEPTANAGADRNADVVGTRIELSGLGSTDPNGSSLTYLWQQTSGPDVALTNPNGPEASFVPNEKGIYCFALTVSNGLFSDDDSVCVSIEGSGVCGSTIASAGLHDTVNENREICLDGGNSASQSGMTLDFEWAKLSGPEVQLPSPFNKQLCFTAPEVCGDQGLVFELTVTTEDKSCRDTDEVVITVRDLAGNCCTTNADCNDQRPCTVDTCDGKACLFTPVLCPEGETCDEMTGECRSICSVISCDDGLFCNGVETCDPATGSCILGETPCAENERCDEESDSCPNPCTSDADCDDQHPCTVDTCAADGTCSNSAMIDCCTSDADCAAGAVCDATTGQCVSNPCQSDVECDDTLFCNGAETCDTNGLCQPGEGPCVQGERCDEGADSCGSPPVSTFDAGDEGWRVDGGAFGGPTAPTWSDTEEYVYIDGARAAFWTAPDKFKGDQSFAFGKALAFEAAWSQGVDGRLTRLVLAGAGMTLNHTPDYDPTPSGSSFWIRLNEQERWFDDATGLRANADQIRTVLSDVSQLKVRAGFAGFSWIDNVVLGAETETPRDTPAMSDFTDSDEAWRLSGGGFGLITRPSQDLENGFVSATDARSALWRSPDSFHGNFSPFLDKRLVIDESWDQRSDSRTARVVFYGGGFKMWTFFGSDPTPTFESFVVRLDETQSWSISTANARATRDQITAVLTNLQRIQILTGFDGQSRLDRVILGAE